MNSTQIWLTLLIPAACFALAAIPIAQWFTRQIFHQYDQLVARQPEMSDEPDSRITSMHTPGAADSVAPMEHVKPFIEEQVDLFMNNRLQELFPLLVKFMGEKTRQQFRQAFLEETERLFPSVINLYLSKVNPGDKQQAEKPAPQPGKNQSLLQKKIIQRLRPMFMAILFLAGLLVGSVLLLCLQASS